MENENELDMCIKSIITEGLGQIYHDAIRSKIQELFGPDTVVYINKYIETKKGFEPEKLKALHEYTKEVTLAFRKIYASI